MPAGWASGLPLSPLGHGEAAKLVLSHRLPALALPTSVPATTSLPLGATPTVGNNLDAPDPALDRTLQEIANAVLVRGGQRVAAVDTLTPSLDGLAGLRSIVLPTCALGVTRLLRRWAVPRGVTVASFQHGIYGLIEGDGGDRRADVLFGWAPEVTVQVQQWAAPRHAWYPSECPTFPACPRPRVRAHRVASLLRPPAQGSGPRWRPGGRANSTSTPSLSDSTGSVPLVCTSKCAFTLPSRRTSMWRWIAPPVGRRLTFAPPGPFADVASRADLLVSPYSSVAFEAAAMGVPVALWIPRIPEKVRRTHLLAPLSEELSGSFADSAGFEELASRALGEVPGGLERLIPLLVSSAPTLPPLTPSCLRWSWAVSASSIPVDNSSFGSEAAFRAAIVTASNALPAPHRIERGDAAVRGRAAGCGRARQDRDEALARRCGSVQHPAHGRSHTGDLRRRLPYSPATDQPHRSGANRAVRVRDDAHRLLHGIGSASQRP